MSAATVCPSRLAMRSSVTPAVAANSTGIVGTKHLFDSLSAPQEAQMGRADVALAIVTNPTYPGYGYWLSQGATSLWETWEGARFHPHSSWNQ